MLSLQWDAKDNGGPFRVSQTIDFSPDFGAGGLFHCPYGFRVAVVGAGVLGVSWEWTDPDGILQAHTAVGIADMTLVGSDLGSFVMWKASLAENPAAVFRLTVSKTLGGGSGSQWDGGFKVFG